VNDKVNRPLFTERPEPHHPVLVVDVAVPVPVDHPFTFELPVALHTRVVPGMRVLVPFAGRRLLGVALEVRAPKPTDPQGKLREVSALVDDAPVLPNELLGFLRELARYYFAPLGEVLALAVPAVERKTMAELRGAGIAPPTTAKIAPSRLVRFVHVLPLAPLPAKKLGPVQAAVLAKIGEGEISLPALTQAFATAPAAVKKLAALGLVGVEERRVDKSPFSEHEARDVPPALTAEQATAVEAITASLDGAPRAFLLHGVTGSGKTEVYLRAIAATLARGKGALVLVPEIALTPQLVARFRARFGDEVAVVHSALDAGARHAMWRRLHAGELRVAIGARSALFAPVPDLGLVVVDEEHDGSFKQEEGVRYHARDGAILRAHRAHAVCVLGSATPSLESVALARQGRMTTLRLLERAKKQPLPSVRVVDLRHVGAGPSGHPKLSLPLHRALEHVLAQKEQAILFLNRRGFAPTLICEACGEIVRCPRCDVSLTLHNRRGTRARRDGTLEEVPPGLRCHYCDHLEATPRACKKCKAEKLSLEGTGTEKLEEVLAAAFPGARVARLDRDVGGGKQVEQILRRVRAREVDILVGTQMVTKGHDLPFVTLVGVIDADGALSLPDFRAAERTFQLLVQVAGRAGRADLEGTVIVQTRSPDHPAIACAARHDVPGFLAHELKDREELGYPPFSRLVLVRLEGPDEPRTAALAAKLAEAARATPEVGEGHVEVAGPMPAPMPRVRERYRYRVLLRGQRPLVRNVAMAVRAALAAEGKGAVRVILDVDPLSMM